MVIAVMGVKIEQQQLGWGVKAHRVCEAAVLL